MAFVYSINIAPVSQIESSLPKRPVLKTHVFEKGLEDDRNQYRARKHNGTLDRAVLLFTVEEMLALGSEGWPVLPGHLGENFTLSGIEPKTIRPGNVYRIGEATVEVTEQATPCKNLQALPYACGEALPAFVKRLSDGRRGWYARVLQEGKVRLHDPVQYVI